MAAPDPLPILVNPASGGGRGLEAALRARERLEARGVRAQLSLTASAVELGSRARAAAARGAATLAVVGGDGTLHRVVREIAGGPTALLAIPCGRGNDFARAVSIPLDPARAADLQVDGQVRPVDLGRVNATPFLTVATIGFDAEAAGVVHRREVPGRGIPAYLLAALKVLPRYRPQPAELKGDFGSLRGPFLLVAFASTRSYGGGLPIAPGARPDDGLLEVCAVAPVGRLRLLLLVARLLRGSHVRHPAVRLLASRAVDVSAPGPLPVYADGEPLATLPARIEAWPGALRVCLPR